MRNGSFVSISDAGLSTLEHLWLAAAGWDDVRTRRGKRHADRRAGLLLSDADLRTRISWDAALDALGIHRSTLFSYAELKQYPEVVDDELDLLILRSQSLGQVEQVAKQLKIPVINAGGFESEPARAMAESLYLIRQGAILKGTTYLMVGSDGPVLRAWTQIAELCGSHLLQLCLRGRGLPKEMQNSAVEVIQVDYRDLNCALKDLSRQVQVVRLSSSQQRLLVSQKAHCFVAGQSECEKLIAPVAAALTERSLTNMIL